MQVVFFELNHNYPTEIDSNNEDYPWKTVTNNGVITKANALEYVTALKSYVSTDMRNLIINTTSPNNVNWYQSIWLGTEREPIHGMYVGSGFPAQTLTGQDIDLTTYVYTLYDKRAAKTLGDIWGVSSTSAMKPNITTQTTQYAEGSVIVKFAFVTACGSDWSPMEGAAVWQIYAPVNISNGTAKSDKSTCPNRGHDSNAISPTLTNVYLMQFDIIVKDSQASTDTGWVFSTLVYDKNSTGNDVWDKMIPLGATWGGNPEIINIDTTALTPPVTVNASLTENWINNNTPAYARSTLGWDGRLSGPNDGAVVQPAWAGVRYYHKGIATAGCIGCHSSAQYPMTSFLLPSTTNPPQNKEIPLTNNSNVADLVLVLPQPGGKLWMKWFSRNSGYTPMGPAKKDGKKPVALDYDMVTAFKAIPNWTAATQANN